MKIYILIILSLHNVNAMNDVEARNKFMSHALDCNTDNSVGIQDFESLLQLKTPTKKKVKCLLACVYKVIGTQDKTGKFDLQRGYQMAEKLKDGDEKRLVNGKKIADICTKAVNEAPVGDDDKGCERAALMFECINKHAAPLGFKFN